jgi:uncharacterized protein (DUF1697 family)
MTVFVALLRAVNVGGTGKLPMADLKQMCERAGFKAVRTYIASGNVVLESGKTEAAVKATLEATLRSYAGKSVGVLVRTAGELAEVLAGDPFPKAPRNLTVVIFLDKAPPKDALKTVTGQKDEEVALGTREIYVYFPVGIGKSKLRIRAAETGNGA